MKTPKTILVTGPAGFIGSNFVKEFAIAYPQTQIIGIDDFSTGRKELLAPSITFYEGSICNRELLDKIFAKHQPEFVFHFAALPRVSYSLAEPTKTAKVNIVGTIQLLEVAKNHGTKRVILSSSSSVYGGAKIMPTAEADNAPNPLSPYALQKYTDELFAKLFSDLYGLETVCLRYFNVFGPNQFGDSAYATVISAWLEGLYFPGKKELFIEGDGSQSRDFCYVSNVVQANIKAMEAPQKINGEVFNVAHGERTDLKTVKNLIEQFTKKTLTLTKRPTRPGDVAHSHADISKAKQWLSYQPNVDFKTGLKKMVQWFESRKL